MKFKRGDNVFWYSQSAGQIKRKEGVIIEVVPSLEIPSTRITTAMFIGNARNHKSYVVKVGYKTYWPRVKYLRKA